MTTDVGNIILDTVTRNRIIDAIWAERTSMPGKAGETPVSNLACEFGKLRDDVAKSAVNAFAQIIDNPPNNMDRGSILHFWQSISFLTQSMNREETATLTQKYRSRLVRPDHLEGECRIQVLNAFIACGGIVTEKELTDDLAKIREEAPIVWVDAAVCSGLFAFAKQQTKLLLKEQAISTPSSVRFLGVVLHSWRKKWPDIKEFEMMINEFPEFIHDNESRAVMNRWLEKYNW